MSNLIQPILNWSEVWALLIPLFVLLLRPKQPFYLKPVILYLWAALFLNLTGDIIGEYNKNHPGWHLSNNPLYNIHSLLRFTCFSYFFILIGLLKAIQFGMFHKNLVRPMHGDRKAIDSIQKPRAQKITVQKSPCWMNDKLKPIRSFAGSI